ncbi:MAG: DUF2634 domain-containing protein [Syntrophomonas sp.]
MPNLFPTESTTVTPETQDQQVKYGKSWRFDFDSGEFVLTPTNQVASADEMEAYIQWCQKAIRTPRYRHLIYSRNYGNEFDDLIGRGYPRMVIESEIKRMATEALMVDVRTANVGNFVFDWQGDAVYFTCDVLSTRGETTQIDNKVVLS